MTRAPTVHLVDASPPVFRAWFSLPDTIVDPAGRPVNAVAGFTAWLLRFLADERPTHLALAFDESLSTSFRNEIFPDYKATREAAPDELKAQFASCRQVGRALGAAVLSDPRYEADDLVGTLARRFARQGRRVVVVSNDKDMAQLVDERVTLFDPVKGARYDAAAVRETWGVWPRQFPDLLGLAGDAVDNIPGVRGIGAKTAAALLAHFDDLEQLYAGIGRVPGLPLRGAAGVAERLRAGREMAFLSRELATIAHDAPVRADLRVLGWRGAERELVDPLFAELGLVRLAGRVPRWR